jgi:glycine cleavage system aminomethyltransferase T
MLRGIREGDRDFVGRDAILREIETGAARWKTVGIMLDMESYERPYADCGLIPPKEGVLIQGSLGLYSSDLDEDPAGSYVGYVTSLSWSPLLKRHIAIAKVPLDRAARGGEVYVELTVAHRPRYVSAHVTPMPFYDPPRKVAFTGGGLR